jgi:type IV pilus assembly protein PilY1
MQQLRKIIAVSFVCLTLTSAVMADDTDIYLDASVASGAEPLVMFTLDYRPNLTSTVCGGTECDTLIAEGYLPATGPYNFFQILRAAMKKVLDPIGDVRVGFMMNYDDNCTGSPTSGPTATGCSNGAYVLSGFNLMSAGIDDPNTYQTAGEDANKVAFFDKLAKIPDPTGTVSHSFQGKELYFELFRYLTGQNVYNGHLGYQSFGDTDPSTNLPDYGLDYSWDTSIEDGVQYTSPIETAGECAKVFVINLMFQVSNQEDDSDAAIKASKASKPDGGMEGINLTGKNNSFNTIIRYLKDADLGDGTFGSVSDLGGVQNVTSYFIVDPNQINITTNGYASAGGTGVALPLSDNPDELVNTLNNIFTSILSVSTTFVSPSVPVNVFNRTQVVNEVFMALFKPDEDGFPLWNGNLKKLLVGENAITGESELQDVNGINAIDIDGRIRRDAVTFWTDVPALPAPVDDEVAGADGRSVPRGGAGQIIPGYIAGGPGAANTDIGARQLFTFDPSDAVDGLLPLDTSATTAATLWTDITAKWAPAASSTTYAGASVAEKNKAVDILEFVRGLEDDGVTTRPWLLADALHSQPLAINYGARGGYDADNPDIRLMMGTNDGFMHMFRNTTTAGDEDGTESWAIIPREVMPILDRLRTNSAAKPMHPTGADGSPAVFTLDVNFDGSIISTDGDLAYLYFGLRRGGKSYYAVDVSDPDTPKLLWKISKGAAGTDFAELGQTWSKPQVGLVKVGGTITPVVIFAGGYNGDDDGDNLGDLGKDAKNRSTRVNSTPLQGTDDDEGNAIYIVNAITGNLVWKAIKGTGIGYVSGQKAFTHPDLVDSFPADVSAVDTDGDRLLDRIYAADTGGVVWRIDLAGMFDHDSDLSTAEILVNNQPSVWSATRLLSVGRHVSGFSTIADDRRFFIRPDVVQSRDGIGPFDGVVIGSGDREDPNGEDVNNFFYLIKDRAITSGLPPATPLEHDDLTDLTSNCLQDSSCTSTPDLSNGWRMALTDSGEKNLASPITAAGSVFFSTFSPTPPTGSCSLSEGTGRLYVVSLQDATAVFNFDTTNDVGDTVLDRVDLLASGGIPVAVVPLGGGELLVQGQEAGQNIMNTGGQMSFKTYWHEIFN